MMQCGWYKEVRVKDLDSHAIKALLVSRALLVKIKRDIENQVRGLLKNFGLLIGQAKMNAFSVRAAELAEARPELAAAVEPLLKAREAVGRQIADLDRKTMRLARNDVLLRRSARRCAPERICAVCRAGRGHFAECDLNKMGRASGANACRPSHACGMSIW